MTYSDNTANNNYKRNRWNQKVKQRLKELGDKSNKSS